MRIRFFDNTNYERLFSRDALFLSVKKLTESATGKI